MNILVGSTGFVGSNLLLSGEFDKAYHSTDIYEAFGLRPDLLVYSGIPATKFIANENKAKDYEIIKEAVNNINKIDPKRIVLISTIDVLDNVNGTDEDYKIESSKLEPYGFNRYKFEKMVADRYENTLIIRLPGLYGENIKKNLIYDYINIIPFMLKENLFESLHRKIRDLDNYYRVNKNGYFQFVCNDSDIIKRLRIDFRRVGFTALNFTDSRNIYQFYPLSHLWDDINRALREDIHLLHLSTEPISTCELIQYLSGNKFENVLSNNTVKYDYRTKHLSIWGDDKDTYIMSKNQILKDIKDFVEKWRVDE